MTIQYNPSTLPAHQRGVALIAGMVILLVLTILGVAAMNLGSVQERMTHNLRESTIALNGGEAALVAGEFWLHQQVNKYAGVPTAHSSCAEPCSSPVLIWRADKPTFTAAWIKSNGRVLGSSEDLSLLAQQPRYIVEQMPFDPGASGYSLTVGQRAGPVHGQRYFRVSATSPGRNDNTQSVLQSIYATRY